MADGSLGRRRPKAPADKEDSELNDIAYDEEKFVMNFTAYTEDSCWKTENLASGRRNPLAKYAVKPVHWPQNQQIFSESEEFFSLDYSRTGVFDEWFGLSSHG